LELVGGASAEPFLLGPSEEPVAGVVTSHGPRHYVGRAKKARPPRGEAQGPMNCRSPKRDLTSGPRCCCCCRSSPSCRPSWPSWPSCASSPASCRTWSRTWPSPCRWCCPEQTPRTRRGRKRQEQRRSCGSCGSPWFSWMEPSTRGSLGYEQGACRENRGG